MAVPIIGVGFFLPSRCADILHYSWSSCFRRAPVCAGHIECKIHRARAYARTPRVVDGRSTTIAALFNLDDATINIDPMELVGDRISKLLLSVRERSPHA